MRLHYGAHRSSVVLQVASETGAETVLTVQ
jgi:hypothetical protein